MLEQELKNAANVLGTSYISLGIYTNNCPPFIISDGTEDACRATSGGSHSVLCTIKLFTATLVAILARKCQFDLDDKLSDIYARFSNDKKDLPPITLTQLLSHSHGMADVNLPPGSRDYLNSTRAQTRLFCPGEFCSYNSVGYEILGSLIEVICEKPFEEALYDELLVKFMAEESRDRLRSAIFSDKCTISAAAGHGLDLSVDELLSFARLLTDPVNGLPSELTSKLLCPVIQMPGFSPFVKATCLGFKDFGNNWYGHNGVSGGAMSFVRINPVTKSAVCLLAGSEKNNIGMLPAMILMHSYPELFSPHVNNPKIDTERTIDENHPLFASFTDYRTILEPYLHEGRLKIRILEEDGKGERRKMHECFLYPAEGDIYLLAKPWKKVNFVQLLRKGSGSNYLWDNDHVNIALS